MVWTAQKLQYGSPKMPVIGRAFAKPIDWLFSILYWLQLYCWCSIYIECVQRFSVNTSNTTVTKKLYREKTYCNASHYSHCLYSSFFMFMCKLAFHLLFPPQYKQLTQYGPSLYSNLPVFVL